MIDPVCGMIRVYRLYLRITVIALMLFAALAPTVRADEYPETPDQVIQWAKDAAQTNPALRQRLLELDKVYEVLFIPGILGSRLEIDGFIWGESPIQAEKLVLNSAQRVKVSMLETFQVRDGLLHHVWKKEDIYGKGLDNLSKALGGKEPKTFPYDWRRDLNEVADDFERFAQNDLKGKKVVVLAHSMGGLMFWHWKNRVRDPNNPRPFTLLALVTLGSPLGGTCEVVRLLIDGYKPYDGASGFENAAYDVIFGKAHGSFFTFPSAFELLWKENSCAYFEDDPGPEGQDLLLLDFWKRRFKQQFIEYARETKMPGSTDEERLQHYMEKVGDALAKAKQFNASFKRQQGKDSIYYLFSSRLKLAMRFILDTENGSLEIIRRESLVGGDGRVPRESATNQKYREIDTGHIYQLDAGHGELLSDSKLMDFFEQEVKLLIQRDHALAIGAYVASDPALHQQFVAQRLLISPTPSGVSPASSSQEDKKKVALLNLEAVAPSSGEASPAGAKRFGRVLEDRERNTAAARVLYKSAAVLDESAMDPRTLNRLGLILLNEKRFEEAAAILQKAAKKAEEAKDPYLTADLKGKIYGNLGTAMFHAGFPKEAREAYAAAKDNPIAQRNLDLLKRRSVDIP